MKSELFKISQELLVVREKMENNRKKLNELASKDLPLTHPFILEASRKFDELHNYYITKEREYLAISSNII